MQRLLQSWWLLLVIADITAEYSAKVTHPWAASGRLFQWMFISMAVRQPDCPAERDTQGSEGLTSKTFTTETSAKAESITEFTVAFEI